MICVIPARGGSTRLPGKNTKDLNGWPVLYYPITAARRSQLFDDIIVSTDDEEIADYADAIGVTVRMRPQYLCGDVPESDVLLDVARLKMVDRLCRIYPFAALLTPERILKGYLQSMKADIVMEVTEYQHSPLRSMMLNGLFELEYLSPDVIHIKTQDLKTFYHDAATYRFCTVDALKKPLAGSVIKGISVSQMECQDVDYPEDFEMLEMKYARRLKNDYMGKA